MELTSCSLGVDFTKIGLGIGYATNEYMEDELKDNELFKLDLIEIIKGQ